MNHDDRIIIRPERQAAGSRTLFGAITALFWALYAYLWLPLITIVAWLVGIRTAALRFYLQHHAIDLYLVTVLPLIAAVCAAILIAWAEYNRYRFRHKERRMAVADVGRSEIASSLGASAAIARALSAAKVTVLHMDEAATPVTVEARGMPAR